MQKDIRITVGDVKIISYDADVELMFWREGNNGECDSDFITFADDCKQYTTEENIENLLANLEYAAALTIEDKVKLAKELQSFIKPVSSDR